ncbi:DUF5345 family protein [Paenibacillus abyssi]|uniref:Uncharacterized protein n=1 Tax=Paenibacillus abyssi TaxID=1340531 RepID=A0A917D3Z7_9BACL|nr:DUF5345 family protein [Paenibacillus abyssi]GGG09223.1 hypothetical protein GCM10010916_27600 [Paenibacillus abyssi]
MTNKLRRLLNPSETSERAQHETEEQAKAQTEFDELFGKHLTAMDDRHSPVVPEAKMFLGMVEEQQKSLKKKLWRDLTLLWLIGCFAASGIVLLLVNDIRWFAGVQIATLAGSLIFLARISIRRVKQKWMN